MGWNPIEEARDFVDTGIGDIVESVVGQSAYDALSYNLGDLAEGAGGVYDDLSGKTASEAAERASATEASAMLEQLDYLKEINALPQQYKEEALTRLSELQTPEGQQAMISQAEASPYYQAIMGGRQAGEESIMRQAGATGGLRSGNVQGALAKYNTGLENRALTESYGELTGNLESLAGLRTNEQQIGGVMAGIGHVQGQGIMGAANAGMQGTQNMFNLGLGVAGLLI